MFLSVTATASQSSSSDTGSFKLAPSSPLPLTPTSSGSPSSSRASLSDAEEGDATVTIPHYIPKVPRKKKKSQEDLRILAISTHITELSYAISDIQTRIFEIQELRHKSQSSGDVAGTTSIIDQSLMTLDERLDSVDKGMKSIVESIEPLLSSAPTPTLVDNGGDSETAALLRKQATLTADWEAVLDESDVLREELKEDKWLTVFRTVTDQADGMMSSLEKAVSRCQDFIWQVHRDRRGYGDPASSYSSLSSSMSSDKSPVSIDTFNSLLDSFEAKKKHYMPATSKVLSIIDRGVQDRVTKNGETLRKHAESAQRWRTLRDRIKKTDQEMENVRKFLIYGETSPSETGSSTSVFTSKSGKNGYLATPPSGSRASNRTSMINPISLSRSISPFRKFARKFTGTNKLLPITPQSNGEKRISRDPSSEPSNTLRRQRSSVLLRQSQQATPTTPERPLHKHSQSLTPDSSPKISKLEVDSISKSRSSMKQRWNSSTRVNEDERVATVKPLTPRRPSISAGVYSNQGIPPVPPVAPQHKRSLSRQSVSSSRPWSPSSSTHQQLTRPPLPPLRPPSRAQTPSSKPALIPTANPRPRPKTPSQIPGPAMRSLSRGRSEAGCYGDEAQTAFYAQRSFTPTSSHPPRPPSRSMIPLPSLHLSSASRPASVMSNYSESQHTPFRSSAARAQTPESSLKARASQITFHTGNTTRPHNRPPVQPKLPPSSYRDSPSQRSPSRSASRAGAHTPTEHNPVYQYIPANPKDPLDAEVAAICNSVAHGLMIERVDAPLKTVPPEGTEVRAQYAFSNALARKVVTCKLTTMARTGTRPSGEATNKKVMCRVGGGWQDLQLYMLNRQAGI